jgi:hypothetical protein
MEITITPKPNQLLPYFAIILLLEKPIPISNYTSIKYTFEWRSADGTLLSTANDFSTDGNYTLTVTDLSIFRLFIRSRCFYR